MSASGVAGVASALLSTPMDVVKTRLMNQAGHASHDYRGPFDALIKIPRQEGFLALYKGFIPVCTRKVVWVTAFFVTYERARKIF